MITFTNIQELASKTGLILQNKNDPEIEIRWAFVSNMVHIKLHYKTKIQ